MFKFLVSPDEGEAYELQSDSRDVQVWEKTNRGASLGALQRDLKMTDLYKIAHLAAQRNNLDVGKLDEFVTAHAIDILEDDGVDPTRQAP